MDSCRSGTIHTWLERFGKQKPRSFSTATTPVDVENWIAHIEKIFEVLGCAEEFKARLASYKLEGDALNWWKAFKQAKGGETYVATSSWKDLCDIFFLQYFPRLAGFVVANAARNIEILHERSSQNNKRNRDGDRIRPTAQGSNQRGYDHKGYDGRSYDRQDGNSQKGYPDYASSPPCVICGKHYPGKECHRVTGACFTCGLTGHMAKNFPKNGGNGGKGNGNDNQPAAKGRVFSLTKDQAANSLEFWIVLIERAYGCILGMTLEYQKALLAYLDVSALDKPHFKLENLLRRFTHESNPDDACIPGARFVPHILDVNSGEALPDEDDDGVVVEPLKVDFRRISLTGFRSRASRSQTGAS
ncbi:zinc finger, CCHC-type, retrotransposon gag domain protein [Tanacetum coccineum]